MKFIRILKAKEEKVAIKFTINSIPHIALFNSEYEANKAFWDLIKLDNNNNEFIVEYNDEIYNNYLKSIKEILSTATEQFILMDDDHNNYNIVNPYNNIPHLFLKNGDSIN